MYNYLKIKRLITENINQLSKKQKKIANYIIENPQSFALKSVRELEEELAISKSTIVRLAQTLGYSGLLEMKRDAKSYISSQLDPLERYETILTEENDHNNYLDIISNEVILNIKKTQQFIDYKQFEKFIDIIEDAKYVHTLGAGISFYLAEIAAYLLNRVSVKAYPFSRGGAPFPEQIVNFNRDDVLFVFYFPAYVKEVRETVIYAKERGLKVVAITDKVTNQAVSLADEFLQVSVESCTISNSISSIIALLYSIIGHIGQEKKQETLEQLQSVKHIRKKHFND